MSDKKYIFIPWVRQGISNLIPINDSLDGTSTTTQHARVALDTSVNLNGTAVKPKDTSGTDLKVSLVGPGDVKSIAEEAILKLEPKPYSNDFESNYFPFIEFYEEDFPWRFTPLSPNATNPEKLRPWLALLVLEKDEYDFIPQKEGLPYISIASGVDYSKIFQKEDQHWAWAHVQFNPTADTDYTDEASILEVIKSDPDSAFSRIVCPRRLEAGRKYEAFLIPSFEVGRLGGLGRDFSSVDIQTPAWDVSVGTTATDRDFPVYKHWEFTTDAQGDFENLVKALTPIEVEGSKGGRAMDIQNTGYNISPSFSKEVKLEGALQPLDYTSMPWPSSGTLDGVAASDQDYITALTNMINLDDEYNSSSTSYYGTNSPFYTAELKDDPIVTPPKYGQWLKRQKRISSGQAWFEDLNINPAYRSVAALGTKVIQKNQESYMERAWNQLGEVQKANQRIRQAELAKWLGESVIRRHLKTDSDSRYLGKSSLLLSKVKDGTDTIVSIVEGSNIPKATLDAGFRKLTRSRLPIFKKSAGGVSQVSTKYSESMMNFDGPTANRNETASLTMPLSASLVDNTPAVTVASVSGVSAAFISNVQDSSNEISSQISPPENTYNLTVASSAYGFTDEPVVTFKEALEAKVNPMLATSSHAKKLYSKVRTLNSSGTAVSYMYQKPIMAHPEIKDNMYEELKDLDSEYLIPNLDSFPNNSVTLLQTNPKFIESYFVGLNHEMSRELLWREYPTDQRGTYFKHFWDKSEADNNDPDVNNLHNWSGDLGSNIESPFPSPASASEGQVVLFIRGDLLNKYPDAIVYAQKAGAPVMNTAGTSVDKDTPKPFDLGNDTDSIPDNDTDDYKKMPVFRMDIEPDITVLGFDLLPSQVRSDINESTGNGQTGWYFVFAERPGKPRFGLDIGLAPALQTWQDLAWGNVKTSPTHNHVDLSTSLPTVIDPQSLTWEKSSADMASITYQKPAMVAIHADRMTTE